MMRTTSVLPLFISENEAEETSNETWAFKKITDARATLLTAIILIDQLANLKVIIVEEI
jgi:hypothetical protein